MALNGYRKSLTWVLDRPALMLLVFLATIGLTVYLSLKVPAGFFPQQDTGVIRGGMQGPQDSSFAAMNKAVHAANLIIAHDPGVQNAMAFTGGKGATNGGFTFIALKPLNQRKHSAAEIINGLRPKLAQVPGAATYLQPVQDIRIGGRQSSASINTRCSAETTADLQQYGPQLLAGCAKRRDFRT